MLNRAALIGNVGKDPDIRTTPAGRKVANFSLATSERWKDKETGQQKEKTEWHRITVWGDELVAKVIEPYVSKGSRLYIEGKITTREWEKDGEKRYSTEIVVQGLEGRIQLLDRKEGGREEPPPADEPPDSRYGEPSSEARRSSQAPIGYQQQAMPPSAGPAMSMAGGRPYGLDDKIPFACEAR